MGPRPRLTRRERQVAAWIKRGCSNREIAGRLGLTEQTVKNYLTCIYEKFGVTSRTQLAVFLNTRPPETHGERGGGARRDRPKEEG